MKIRLRGTAALVSVIDAHLRVWSPSAKAFVAAATDGLFPVVASQSPNHTSLGLVDLGEIPPPVSAGQYSLCLHGNTGGQPIADPLPFPTARGVDVSAPGVSVSLVPTPPPAPGPP